jgi:hypothetical protein
MLLAANRLVRRAISFDQTSHATVAACRVSVHRRYASLGQTIPAQA